jgi:glycosyltransferase involved in cell wall biosynthesis
MVNESIKEELRRMGFTKVFVKDEGSGMNPLEDIPLKESSPTIVYLGRLTRAKRVDHLIRAFSRVKERIPDARLWVAGDGYMRKDLESISGPDCSFFGRVSDENKRHLLERAWVLVQPSIFEGFSLVVIEANANGTPAVAFQVSALQFGTEKRVFWLKMETFELLLKPS